MSCNFCDVNDDGYGYTQDENYDGTHVSVTLEHGVPYCSEDPGQGPMWYVGIEGWRHGTTDTLLYDLRVRYCPMCGRELR